MKNEDRRMALDRIFLARSGTPMIPVLHASAFKLVRQGQIFRFRSSIYTKGPRYHPGAWILIRREVSNMWSIPIELLGMVQEDFTQRHHRFHVASILEKEWESNGPRHSRGG